MTHISLLIVLLICANMGCPRADLIPSRMEGQYLPEDIHVVRLVVGTPGRTMRFALDFSDRFMRIARPLTSATFSHTAGGTDVVHVGRRRLRLPLRVDPEAAERLGCPTCDGTLGVGSASPLWLFYGSATFTPGAVLLGTTPAPIAAARGGYSRCLGPHPTLCITEAQVHGHRYMVDLSFRTAETLVPMRVYDRFVGTRSVGKDPSHRWDPLRIHFLGGTEVAIGAHNLVAMEKNGVRRLMVGLSPRNDTIYPGRTALRSMMIRRDFLRGTAKIIQWDTRKHRTATPLILTVVLSALFMHWTLTRDGMLPSPDGQPRQHLYPDRAVLEVVGAGLVVVAYYLPTVREAVRINPTFDAFVFFGVLVFLTWEWAAVAIYWWSASVVVGDLYARKPKTEGPPGTPIPASRNPAQVRQRRASPFTKTGATGRDIRGPRRRPRPIPIGRSHFVVRSRLALIRKAAHAVVLVLGILILATEARTDSFAVAAAAIFSLILVFVILYHLLMTVYHSFGYDRIGLWVLFLGTLLIMFVITVVLTYGEVVLPYFERRLFTAQWMVTLFVVIVYGAVVLVAASVSEVEIRKERAFFRSLRLEQLVPATRRAPYFF